MIATTNEGVGGSERVAVNLAQELSARGWTVRYLYPRGIPNESLLRGWCEEKGVDGRGSAALPTAGDETRVRTLVALYHLYRSQRADVINLHYGYNYLLFRDILMARLATRARVIATVNHPVPWSGRRRRIATFCAALLCDAVVVLSGEGRHVTMQAGVPSKKIQVIYPGEWPPTQRPSRQEARARLGLPDDAFVVSTLARLTAHKGIGTLIAAVARVADPSERLRLVIAGDGPERAALAECAATRLGHRALFLGQLPDTALLYAASDVFALPSEMEGFGLVFSEAAAFGVPSIGTWVGGIPDAVLNERTGLLVPVGDVAALSQAIDRLYNDPALCHRLGSVARQRVTADLTPAAMVDRYLALF